MGTTCANLHIIKRGLIADANLLKALPKAYAKIGYALPKKTQADPPDRTVLLALDKSPGAADLYDSNNVQLDSGDLKELACEFSKQLKTTAVVITIYDSDSFEFLIYSGGKQADAVVTNEEGHEGELKVLKPKARASKWFEWFVLCGARPQALPSIMEQMQEYDKRLKEIVAKKDESVFAEETVSRLCELTGISAEAALSNFHNIEEEVGSSPVAPLKFMLEKKSAVAAAAAATSRADIILKQYLSEDDCPYHTLFPGSWPAPPNSHCTLQWLITSQAKGFTGCTINLDIESSHDDASGVRLSELILRASAFYNGQITSMTPLQESKWKADADQSAKNGFEISFPQFAIADVNPDAKKQILLQLIVSIDVDAPGEFTLRPSITTHGDPQAALSLWDLRLSSQVPAWTPLVSAAGKVLKQPRDQRAQFMQSNLNLAARSIALLNHDAVVHGTAILSDCSEQSFDQSRDLAETFLTEIVNRIGAQSSDVSASGSTTVRVHTEKHMTESAYVGKSTRDYALSPDLLTSKNWRQLFDDPSKFQCVEVSIIPPGYSHAIAGMLIEFPLSAQFGNSENTMLERLQAMIGSDETDKSSMSETCLHVSWWSCNAEEITALLGHSAQHFADMFSNWIDRQNVLQAWQTASAQIPKFDRYDNFEKTLYEESCIYPWFHSGLYGLMMLRGWCANKIRYVAKTMWLSQSLFKRLDTSRISALADVTDHGEKIRLTLKDASQLPALEEALLPLLPVERDLLPQEVS